MSVLAEFFRGGVVALGVGLVAATGVATISIAQESRAQDADATQAWERGAESESAPAEAKQDPFAEAGIELATSDFPENSRGLTYGSDAEAENLKESPDLVAVVGDNGVGGFVYEEDLAGPEPSSPEEAATAQGEAPRVLTVYDVSGTKVVDTFTLATPQVSTTAESE